MPCYNTAKYKRLQHSLYHPCNYTTQTPKPFAWLYSGFSFNLRYSSAHNTAATQAAYTHLHPAGWHTVKRYTCTDTRYYRRAGRCTGHSSRPIIIRYIRVQLCAPCYRSMPDSAAYRRPCQRQRVSASGSGVSPAAGDLAPGQPGTFHPVWQSSSKSTVGGAEPLTATAASLFGLSPDS